MGTATPGASLEAVFAQRTVPIDEIGRALSSMWRAADGISTEKGESAIVRSRALTLIAISESATFPTMANAVNAAIAVVPARSVIVEIASCDGVTAQVGGTCTIGGSGGKQFCQEQVVVKASNSTLRDLPSILVPLAVSDLPLVLFVPDTKLLRSDLVAQLVPVVDVLIVDSDGCADVADTFQYLARLENIEHLIVRDIAFERLRTWREVIAAGYDEVAGAGARVTAVQATCADNDAQGSLVLGWLESRFAGDQRPFVRMRRQVDDPSQKGAVCGIDLEVHDDDKRTDIHFKQFGNHVLRLRSDEEDGTAAAELPRPLLHPFAALTHVLADPIRDIAYDQALRAVIARYSKGR